VQTSQLGELGRITSPTYFVLDNKADKRLTRIIITTQVPQALGVSKSQTKIVFDVGGFHLAPTRYLWSMPCICP
jgi:hypothetical protein